MQKLNFKNGKTQFTGDLLAWTGRAMRSKKTPEFDSYNQNQTCDMVSRTCGQSFKKVEFRKKCLNEEMAPCLDYAV